MRAAWREYLTKQHWIRKIPLSPHQRAAFLTKNWSALQAYAPTSVTDIYPLSPKLLPQLVTDQLILVNQSHQLLLANDRRQHVIPWAPSDEELVNLSTRWRHQKCELGFLKLVDTESGQEQMRSELLKGDTLRLLDFHQLWRRCRQLLNLAHQRAGAQASNWKLQLHHLHPAPELLLVTPRTHLYFLSALSHADCKAGALLATHLGREVSVRAVGHSQWSYEATFII